MSNDKFSIGAAEWPGISKLIEECGEVALVTAIARLTQTCGKLIGSQGIVEHWDGTDLKTMLEDELADLHAAILFVARHNPLNTDRMTQRTMAKLERFERWHTTAGAPEQARCPTCQGLVDLHDGCLRCSPRATRG